jgi:hypothetical protein
MLQLSLNVKWKVYLYLKLNGKSTWNFIKGRLGIGDGSPSDGKSSHCLWQGELKRNATTVAKNLTATEKVWRVG